MGERFTFTCEPCGYLVLVSGSGDAGMSICIQTILCFDCKVLMDIVAAATPAEEEELDIELIDQIEESQLWNVRMKCENDANHRWREWNSPDICPKCGGPMPQSPGPMELWD